ncbi:maturin isoform X1 [Bubalus kerabau]|uniref:maturin isoform X1 n=1 Tax=Bubalus carabanensis TaxID=3119969 RepID=UPI00244E6B4D|nr:maturin isoform X1 [Bubalus carabanensis]
MDFQQLADVAEKWCSNTPFELIATEETERRMDFYADPGVSFYVLCPDNGCGDNFAMWSLCKLLLIQVSLYGWLRSSGPGIKCCQCPVCAGGSGTRLPCLALRVSQGRCRELIQAARPSSASSKGPQGSVRLEELGVGSH